MTKLAQKYASIFIKTDTHTKFSISDLELNLVSDSDGKGIPPEIKAFKENLRRRLITTDPPISMMYVFSFHCGLLIC